MSVIRSLPRIASSSRDAHDAVRNADAAVATARFARRVTINHAVKVCEWDGLTEKATAVRLGISIRRVRRELRREYEWLGTGAEHDVVTIALDANWRPTSPAARRE